MYTVKVVPIFTDNYVFIIHNNKDAIIVDPGDSQPVLNYLKENQLQAKAVLLTHHHNDHIGGIDAFAHLPIYASHYDQKRILYANHFVNEGDRLQIDSLEFQVLDVKGHTLGHIAYYEKKHGWLFSGDTIFKLGCGRLFEGSAEQMWTSLQKIKQLPASTLIYCTHEYTLHNLAFCKSFDPKTNWAKLEDEIVSLRQAGLPSIPSTVDYETKYNPFLKASSAKDFAEIRKAKDHFHI
jgi:hydroxyacylglutathione hydrolase